MSLVVVIKGPEGLVLASDSRMSSYAGRDYVTFDNATKLLSFSAPNTSIAAMFVGTLKGPSSSYAALIPAFEATLPSGRLTVEDFAHRLSDFFSPRAAEPRSGGPSVQGFVCGFDEGDTFGRIFMLKLPAIPECPPFEVYPGETFGITWDGQRDVLSRLLLGYSERLPEIVAGAAPRADRQLIEDALQPLRAAIPFELMALQDCVELAQFLIRTTTNVQRFTVGRRGVGGPIQVATITAPFGVVVLKRETSGCLGGHGGVGRRLRRLGGL